jgi:adenine-specific DNA methylase
MDIATSPKETATSYKEITSSPKETANIHATRNLTEGNRNLKHGNHHTEGNRHLIMEIATSHTEITSPKETVTSMEISTSPNETATHNTMGGIVYPNKPEALFCIGSDCTVENTGIPRQQNSVSDEFLFYNVKVLCVSQQFNTSV